jgi:hypothetical protein
MSFPTPTCSWRRAPECHPERTTPAQLSRLFPGKLPLLVDLRSEATSCPREEQDPAMLWCRSVSGGCCQRAGRSRAEGCRRAGSEIRPRAGWLLASTRVEPCDTRSVLWFEPGLAVSLGNAAPAAAAPPEVRIAQATGKGADRRGVTHPTRKGRSTTPASPPDTRTPNA